MIKTMPLRRILRWVERTLAIMGLLFVIYFLAFDFSFVVSGSMSPTLQGESLKSADCVLSEKITYSVRKPRRWEIVMYRSEEDGAQIMKRVTGLPGETISIKDKWVCVNGFPVEHPSSLKFLRYYPYGNMDKKASVACGKGYYVLGDFTTDSQDSRFEGPLAPERILARPWLIVWPWSRIGFVNP